VQRHYGTTQGVTEIVLAANKALAGQIFSTPARWWSCRNQHHGDTGDRAAMDLINRIWNGVTYSWSTLTSVGVMTQKDWLPSAC
jgi:hypothetical protein